MVQYSTLVLTLFDTKASHCPRQYSKPSQTISGTSVITDIKISKIFLEIQDLFKLPYCLLNLPFSCSYGMFSTKSVSAAWMAIRQGLVACVGMITFYLGKSSTSLCAAGYMHLSVLTTFVCSP